jgi:YfiH family protein
VILNPFAIFRPFEDRLAVVMLTKVDDVRSDNDAKRSVGATRSAGLWQEHGDKTIMVWDQTDRTEKADGMITDRANLALCIRWADCQNFVVYAPEKHVLGVLHAGWKGILVDAIPKFFESLKADFGVDAKDTYVGAGPSLCMKCAEFGVDHEVLQTLPSNLIDGRLANLQGEALRQLIESGVREDRIERHPDCTRCTPETYWTYRGGHREDVIAGHTNMLVATLK